MNPVREPVMNEADNRRQIKDRRKRDMGPPPGWRDRRSKPDRRLPELDELQMSAEDFAKMFGRPQTS